MACVVLFFAFAKRRIGPIPALVPCISLLFLGYGWEAFLWAFDMHTIYALAFGLGALLLLERGDSRGDVGACVLLVLSIGMIELGLAFTLAVAVAVLLLPDRWRRVWVFLVPLALYAIWWMWSRQFHQSSIAFSNIRLFPKTVTDALAAIAGSVFGLNPTGPGVPQPITEITAWGAVVAGIAVVALVYRISRGKVPPELWVFAVVALGYWGLIAFGARAGGLLPLHLRRRDAGLLRDGGGAARRSRFPGRPWPRPPAWSRWRSRRTCRSSTTAVSAAHRRQERPHRVRDAGPRPRPCAARLRPREGPGGRRSRRRDLHRSEKPALTFRPPTKSARSASRPRR